MPPTPPTRSPQQAPFATEDGQDAAMPQVLKRLEIITKRRVENLFAGAYQAIFQGQGMVFADVRPYQPGDEVRWIDWNVSARMNEMYIKQFVEERERTVMLLWDASPSMDLGHRERTKREMCAEVAMLLAMSAIHNGDRVGLILFADKVERYIAPQRGRKHVMRMISEILQCKPSPDEQHSTAMTEALHFFNRVAPRHTIGFVMSDFLAPFEEGLWQLLARKCDMMPLILTDPLERKLPSAETAPNTTATNEAEIPQDDPNEPSPREEPQSPPAAEALDNPWLTLVVGALCAIFGLWMGGMWQWTGLATLALCGVVAYTLRSADSGAICQLQDLETRATSTIDLTNPTTHAALQARAEEHQTRLAERFLKMQVEPVFLPTEEDYLTTLLRFFRRKQKRSR